jgi:hypothetical protein
MAARRANLSPEVKVVEGVVAIQRRQDQKDANAVSALKCITKQ